MKRKYHRLKPGLLIKTIADLTVIKRGAIGETRELPNRKDCINGVFPNITVPYHVSRLDLVQVLGPIMRLSIKALLCHIQILETTRKQPNLEENDNEGP